MAKIVFVHTEVDSYSSCVEAGYRVVDGAPSQCITPDGLMYSEPSQAHGLQEREASEEQEDGAEKTEAAQE